MRGMVHTSRALGAGIVFCIHWIRKAVDVSRPYLLCDRKNSAPAGTQAHVPYVQSLYYLF
jgi:hypothetical protein